MRSPKLWKRVTNSLSVHGSVVRAKTGLAARPGLVLKSGLERPGRWGQTHLQAIASTFGPFSGHPVLLYSRHWVPSATCIYRPSCPKIGTFPLVMENPFYLVNEARSTAPRNCTIHH